MSKINLYRKYRPKTFSDMCGQEEIVKTIKNSIVQNMVSHAYLFCGPKGTGKTSTAKIFANALNCLDDSSVEPCMECEICKSFQKGAFLDIVEIDAASNRGIDEIRNLRENVRFAPAEGKYKVYIIDEIHMLTNEAFNAFLKTLEEPPTYVKFVLATTEPHKILPTIISRCIRFDFKNITIENIINRLEYIVKQENEEYKKGIEFDYSSYLFIAKGASGGLRDAISILEKVLTFSETDKITYKETANILGITLNENLFSVLKAFFDKDIKLFYSIVDELFKRGNSFDNILANLILLSRNLLVYKYNNKDFDKSFTENELDKFKEFSKKYNDEKILKLISFINDSQQNIRDFDDKKLFFELLFLDFINKTSENERIIRLEKEVKDLKSIIESGELTVTTTVAKSTTPQQNVAPQQNIAPQQKVVTETVIEDVKPDFADEGDIDETFKLKWKSISEAVKRKNQKVGAFFIEVHYFFTKDKVVYLLIDDKFIIHKDLLSRPENIKFIEAGIFEVMRQRYSVELHFASERKNIQKKNPNSTSKGNKVVDTILSKIDGIAEIYNKS